jgi:hypothetical protein
MARGAKRTMGVETAIELYDLAVAMLRQRLTRQLPKLSAS